MTNKCAVDFNGNVKNDYGPQKYLVTHSGGIKEMWTANNKDHLNLLLRTEINMEYMLKIENIESLS